MSSAFSLPQGAMLDFNSVDPFFAIPASPKVVGAGSSTGKRPTVPLPGPHQTISNTARQLGQLLAAERTHFVRGGVVVRVTYDAAGVATLSPVKATQLMSDFEKVATLAKVTRTSDRPITLPTTCSKAMAEAIGECQEFLAALPSITLVSRCPVLVEEAGELRVITGYDEASGILAEGTVRETIELGEAIELLEEVVADFHFTTAADRSRALAALITPALVMGGLLPGRAALDLSEANESQSGKGYRHKLTAAIYGQKLAVAVQQRSGVGSMEEAFDQALISGRNFISLDNVKGRVDSPKIESFLTEDSYNARCSHSRNMELDPRRVIVMFTSNKADVTKDLANRCSCVRIVKQEEGYTYRQFAEGDLLDHIRSQQPKYLAAVFAVVKAWHAASKPRTSESRHDFRGWAQTLDWIVQQEFQTAPLLDGHRETQARMTNPSLNWLRDVLQILTRQGKAGQWLFANDILDALDEEGEISIPGVREGSNLEEESVRKQALSQIGRIMKRCFGDQDYLELDGLTMDRKRYRDTDSRDRSEYSVGRVGELLEVPF